MKPAVEQAAHLLQTDAFIKADVEQITLTRHTKDPDGSGGWVEAETTLSPQQFRIQPLGSRFSAPERQSAAGSIIVPSHELIGYADADIEAGDEFQWNGDHYEVIFVDTAVSYRTRAEVIRGGA